MYSIKSFRKADCDYCERYQYACGRHATIDPRGYAAFDTPLPTL